MGYIQLRWLDRSKDMNLVHALVGYSNGTWDLHTVEVSEDNEDTYGYWDEVGWNVRDVIAKKLYEENDEEKRDWIFIHVHQFITPAGEVIVPNNGRALTEEERAGRL